MTRPPPWERWDRAFTIMFWLSVAYLFVRIGQGLLAQ